MVAMGLWRSKGLFGGIGPRIATRVEARDRGRRPDRLRAAADRHAVRRADAAHAVRAPAAAGRARDRARRAVQCRSTPRPRRSARSGAALACASSARCWPRCTTSKWCKANFPETLLLAREPVAWGATAEVLTPENMLQGAADVRGVRRAGAGLRGGGVVVRMLYDHPHRAVRRFRVHAPRAGRHACAGARRGADRRVPDAAPHEPDRRRHGACHPAGRRDRLHGRGAQPVRDGGRRARCGLHRRRRRRPDRALDAAQGGRLARGVLSDLARARRHDRFGQGHQRRSAALPVRLGAGGGRSDAAADRRHHQRVAA